MWKAAQLTVVSLYEMMAEIKKPWWKASSKGGSVLPQSCGFYGELAEGMVVEEVAGVSVFDERPKVGHE